MNGTNSRIFEPIPQKQIFILLINELIWLFREPPSVSSWFEKRQFISHLCLIRSNFLNRLHRYCYWLGGLRCRFQNELIIYMSSDHPGWGGRQRFDMSRPSQTKHVYVQAILDGKYPFPDFPAFKRSHVPTDVTAPPGAFISVWAYLLLVSTSTWAAATNQKQSELLIFPLLFTKSVSKWLREILLLKSYTCTSSE